MTGCLNVILVVVDTLRYDFVGANGNNWIQTPNIDKIAAESWVFDRCFSASYPTIPHRSDVITGKCGESDQVFNPWMPLRYDVITFPQLLAKAGFRTQLICDTPHLINGGHNFDWPFHAWTFVRGAEVDPPWINDSKSKFPSNWRYNSLFDFIDKNQAPNWYISYARANYRRKKYEDWNVAKLFITASDWLNDNASRNNFFLWIDCFDPHEPWDAPPEFLLKYNKSMDYNGNIDPRSLNIQDLNKVPVESRLEVAKYIKSLYSAKVSWMDKWLGLFINTLEELGLTENTAVIFTSDHGTNLGEQFKIGKSIPVKEQEGHIPLFIKAPGYGIGRNDLFVQPQDLFTTILSLAGVKNSKQLLDSYNILDLAVNEIKRKDGPRQVAISGVSTTSCNSGWKWREPKQKVFTVFGKEYYSEFAVNPKDCSLTQYQTLENVASSHKTVIYDLRKAAITELSRRKISPKIIKWIKDEGKTRFPKIKFPGPKGYNFYWTKSLNSW
jgi:arylsulfatase A-like enzyme